MLGQLYIVATPLGNLDDMSFRAVEVLKSVASIAAEDTRHSQKLLHHYGVTTPMISLHDHNEADKSHYLVKKLLDGSDIALISDAGTPLVSDPGYRLVSTAQDAGIKVVPVPGPCALIAALVASGLPADKFYFEGFLPAKTKARKQRLGELAAASSTVICYESRHRIMACLADIEAVLGNEREVCLAKELTKCFETIKRGTVDELIAWLEADERRQQGEFVVLLRGALVGEADMAKAERVLVKLMAHLPLKIAASLASEMSGINKNKLYELGLALKEKK